MAQGMGTVHEQWEETEGSSSPTDWGQPRGGVHTSHFSSQKRRGSQSSCCLLCAPHGGQGGQSVGGEWEVHSVYGSVECELLILMVKGLAGLLSQSLFPKMSCGWSWEGTREVHLSRWIFSWWTPQGPIQCRTPVCSQFLRLQTPPPIYTSPSADTRKMQSYTWRYCHLMHSQWDNNNYLSQTQVCEGLFDYEFLCKMYVWHLWSLRCHY